MKIFVKTLKGTQFEIEVNLQDTIADVKKNIESVQGQDVYPAARQMLIHQGQILKDDTTVEENKISENRFIVIMLSKVVEKKTAPPPPPVAAPTPATVTPLIDLNPNQEGVFKLNLDINSLARELLSIYNISERAVEHLNSGIPEPPEVPPPPPPPPPPVPGSQPVNSLPRGPNADPLDIFPHEREVSGGVKGRSDSTTKIEKSKKRLIDIRDVITLAPEEVDAIERLIAMGFEESVVIDVFLACNKNEEVAANYLLDHMDEFH